MNKIFTKLLIYLGILFFFIFPQKTFADENFDISYNNKYSIIDEKRTNVEQTTTLINKKTNLYPSSYEVIVFGDIIGDIQASDSTGKLKIETTKEGNNKSKIHLDFNNKSVGVGNQLTFTLSYTLTGLVNKYGRVKEITIPKVLDDPSLLNYQVELNIPKNFGPLAYLKPMQQVQQTDDAYNIVYDTKDAIRGVIIGFGDFAVYKFNVNYHLKNNSLIARRAEIALPPDTLYQQVIYSNIDPLPLEANIDKDGNSLASYDLLPRQSLEIKTNGYIVLFTQARDNFKDIIPGKQYLSSNKYWEVNSTEVTSLKEEFKNVFDIYQYITQNLKYNYSRVNLENQRMGAKEALKSKDKAICMEFTDTFIALSRSIGVPAREVNGYAYTTDEYLKPLSLVADVLHAWPEFWDATTSSWVAIDPTWASTTGGLDYFHSLDLSHIVFVRRGISSTYPLAAGSYRQEDTNKDIEIIPQDSLPQFSFKPLIFTVQMPKKMQVNKNQTINIKIRNPEGIGRYGIPLKITAPDCQFDLTTNQIDIPPFGELSVNANIKYLRKNYWGSVPITVSLGQDIQNFNVTVQPQELLIFIIYLIAFIIFLVLTYQVINKNVFQKRNK